MRREGKDRGLIWDPISALFIKIKGYENMKKSVGLYLLPRRCELRHDLKQGVLEEPKPPQCALEDHRIS
jgi:hypothetical protein